ncbi:MAG: S8 family serine peptidase, partial [Gaiellaceae bacterium]
MRRPLLLLALAALVAVPPASAAEPVQWFLAAVGAAQTAAPGPGVPLTIVDSGVDASQPDFAGRPDTTYLNAQTVSGPGEFHGTEVASVAAAPANGTGISGVYPRARLEVWDATPTAASPQPSPGVAAARCPGVIELSLG